MHNLQSSYPGKLSFTAFPYCLVKCNALIKFSLFLKTECSEWSIQADFNAPYLKNFLKKLITEVELEHGNVLDNLYELYAQYMTSLEV